MAGKGKKHLVNGEWITIAEACKKYNITQGRVRNRMHDHGLTLQEAIDYVPNKVTRNKGNSEWQKLGERK